MVSRHQIVLRKLWEKTRDLYDKTILNKEYYDGEHSKDIVGEIDMLGYKEKNDTIDLYEVKSSLCSCGILKGLNQLDKSEKYLKDYVSDVNKVLVLSD